MKFEIRGRGLDVTGEWTERAARRLGFALDRFGDAVASVDVVLTDRNGPRGGIDKRCEVAVRGQRGWQARGSADSDDAGAAIDVAIERAARAVARIVGRDGQLRDRRTAADVGRSGEADR